MESRFVYLAFKENLPKFNNICEWFPRSLGWGFLHDPYCIFRIWYGKCLFWHKCMSVLFTNLIFFIFSYTSSVLDFLNHNFLQQSIFAFGIVELLLILLHFSDLVYIGIGTKNERQIEEVIYCFDCVVSFAQKKKIKIIQKA